jgi:hypothetical protein
MMMAERLNAVMDAFAEYLRACAKRLEDYNTQRLVEEYVKGVQDGREMERLRLTGHTEEPLA